METYKVGQLIWGIEFDNDVPAEIAGYLFLSECKEYIICAAKYSSSGGDIDSQISEMYTECMEEYEVKMNMLKKEYTFATQAAAQECLESLE